MVKWKRDRGLQARMLLTMFLLTALYLVFLAFLASMGFGTGFLLFVAALFIGIQYFFSDKMVLLTTGAQLVSDQEQPNLHETVTRLCAIADIPIPAIAVVHTKVPNAFATGRSPKKAVVAVTTGLMNQLDQDELEAVLAHELSHVKNRDMTIMTIASFLSTVAFFMVRFSPYLGMSGQRGKGAGGFMLVLLVSLIVWILSYLLIRALSRYREFAADRGSARITGRPSSLASALMKISGLMAQIPGDDLRSVEGMNAFFIIPALSGSSILDLFATHPPVEQRIAALEKIERGMEF